MNLKQYDLEPDYSNLFKSCRSGLKRDYFGCSICEFHFGIGHNRPDV